MRIIPAASYVTMPWRNGGGTTTEIAVSPPGADMAAFDWRLSMARVERAGPFSVFDGIDRTIAILEGDGLTLSVAGGGEVCLDKALAPYGFPGDVAAGAVLVGGPVLDLNLMSRRAGWRHALVRTVITGTQVVQRLGDVLLVLVRGSAASITDTDTILAGGDTLFLDHTDPPETKLAAAAPARLYLAHLWRR
mgnify:CR=1 FL=1